MEVPSAGPGTSAKTKTKAKAKAKEKAKTQPKVNTKTEINTKTKTFAGTCASTISSSYLCVTTWYQCKDKLAKLPGTHAKTRKRKNQVQECDLNKMNMFL